MYNIVINYIIILFFFKYVQGSVVFKRIMFIVLVAKLVSKLYANTNSMCLTSV